MSFKKKAKVGKGFKEAFANAKKGKVGKNSDPEFTEGSDGKEQFKPKKLKLKAKRR